MNVDNVMFIYRIIDSEDGDYIMQVIREDYLHDSTVTIFIIGEHSSEKEGTDFYGRDKKSIRKQYDKTYRKI